MDAREAFFTLHRDLPREGPGSRESTATALFSAPLLPARPRILDLGCGPGAQTIDLALLLPDARITALDAHAPFLDALRARAASAGVSGQITAVQGDLGAPPPGEYDLVWCEGAAYFVGFQRALALWEPLLTRGGAIALTEPVWLTDAPTDRLPARLRACFAEYPDMQTRGTRLRQIAEMGLRCHNDFVLPERDWWSDYYEPMIARIAALRAEYRSMPPALEGVLREAEEEIAVYREYHALYGYAFFVVGRPEDHEEEV